MHYSIFTDKRDNESYRTVKIGNVEWMADNLRHKHPDSESLNYSDRFDERYGRFFPWSAALASVPEGWMLPTVEVWRDLAAQFDGFWGDNYNELVEKGIPEKELYNSKLLGGYETYQQFVIGGKTGLDIILTGHFSAHDQGFSYVDVLGRYWTSSKSRISDSGESWAKCIDFDGNLKEARVNEYNVNNGYVCRCIRIL